MGPGPNPNTASATGPATVARLEHRPLETRRRPEGIRGHGPTSWCWGQAKTHWQNMRGELVAKEKHIPISCQQGFDTIKRRLCTHAMLTTPVWDRDFMIAVDASLVMLLLVWWRRHAVRHEIGSFGIWLCKLALIAFLQAITRYPAAVYAQHVCGQ